MTRCLPILICLLLSGSMLRAAGEDLLAAAQAKNKSNLDRTRIAITGGHTRVGQLLANKIELICHKPLLLDFLELHEDKLLYHFYLSKAFQN
jgi:hypothetical protein